MTSALHKQDKLVQLLQDPNHSQEISHRVVTLNILMISSNIIYESTITLYLITFKAYMQKKPH